MNPVTQTLSQTTMALAKQEKCPFFECDVRIGEKPDGKQIFCTRKFTSLEEIMQHRSQDHGQKVHQTQIKAKRPRQNQNQLAKTDQSPPKPKTVPSSPRPAVTQLLANLKPVPLKDIIPGGNDNMMHQCDNCDECFQTKQMLEYHVQLEHEPVKGDDVLQPLNSASLNSVMVDADGNTFAVEEKAVHPFGNGHQIIVPVNDYDGEVGIPDLEINHERQEQS